MSNSMLEAALTYRAAGISVIPINPQTKRPYVRLLPKDADGNTTWKPYQETIADEATMRGWFTNTDAQVGVVCGRISGGLLVIDHDALCFYDAWRGLVGELAGGLPVQETGNGRHVLLRCPEPGHNQHLAWKPDDTEGTGRKIAIETRGEGGYIVAAPSLHPSGKRYRVIQGDLTAIPTISQARADALLAAARKLDQAPQTRQQIEAAAKVNFAPRARLNGQASVIDTYNQQVDVTDLLNAHGYTQHGKRWTRPGGEHGSVTVKDNKSFHHNSNDPRCNGYWHDPFSVFCELGHQGDMKAAVKAAAATLGLELPKHGTTDANMRNAMVTINVGASRPQTEPATDGTPPMRRWLTEDEIDDLQPPAWLIKGVVPAGEVTMVIGPGDAGKTFVVVDMAKRVAEHYPVMYVAAEDASGIKIRKRAWELHYQRPKTGNFMMWNGVLPLFDDQEVKAFLDEVRTLGLRMIVIDTLSQSIAGADENSSKDMALIMHHCQQIARETGAAVVIIHHTTKGGEAYRGSSTIKNNTYAFLNVSKENDVIKLECGRIKNAKPFPNRFFQLVTVATGIYDEEGSEITSCVILPVDRVMRGDELSRNEIRMLVCST